MCALKLVYFVMVTSRGWSLPASSNFQKSPISLLQNMHWRLIRGEVTHCDVSWCESVPVAQYTETVVVFHYTCRNKISQPRSEACRTAHLTCNTTFLLLVCYDPATSITRATSYLYILFAITSKLVCILILKRTRNHIFGPGSLALCKRWRLGAV